MLVRLGKQWKYLVLISLALLPFIVYKTFQFSWYVQAIPLELNISYPIEIAVASSFREGCGVAVYKLSASTLDALKKSELESLQAARQGRGYLDVSDPHHSYYSYGEWKETPVPASWTSEGAWFGCEPIGDALTKEILSAAKKNGSYYTEKNEGELLVIPSLGYVVFSFWG